MCRAGSSFPSECLTPVAIAAFARLIPIPINSNSNKLNCTLSGPQQVSWWSGIRRHHLPHRSWRLWVSSNTDHTTGHTTFWTISQLSCHLAFAEFAQDDRHRPGNQMDYLVASPSIGAQRGSAPLVCRTEHQMKALSELNFDTQKESILIKIKQDATFVRLAAKDGKPTSLI